VVNNNKSYPIVAIATPPGAGAIAIVRVSGASLKNVFFSMTKKKTLPKNRYATLCNIYSSINSKLIDRCIVTYYKGPNSFTGEDVIEINCHGGNLIPQLIVESLLFFGVKKASPGEFSYRSFLNNKIDLIQAESIASLITSKSDLNHEIALKNLNGFFSKTIVQLSDNIVSLLSILENELNFNEEEISFTSKKTILNNLKSLSSSLAVLYNTSFFGKVIETGFRIVLLGRPNVGKSSLFNHLLGKNKAIVSDISGTTRDLVEGNSEINGFPVCFVDTAGYWESNDFLESLGIKKTLEEISSANFILFIDDKNPTKQFNDFNLNIDTDKILFVQSKADKPPSKKHDSIIYCSTVSGLGINHLINSLSKKLSSFNDSGPIITSERQKGLIEYSLTIIENSIKMVKDDIEIDLILSNIRDVLFNLESLTGKIYTKDIINNIFNKFCIGK
tara:strand:+ start:1527 stop:2864 length:1338 start_codon:yes stop_codon:yes gene_type:complete